jgi:hypothetical protein
MLKQDRVCVVWRGLDPQQFDLEVGLGTASGHDDVIKFQPVANGSHACLNVSSAPVYVRLFSVVRATSPGGSSVYSSDGFVLVPDDDPSNDLQVFHGPGCHDSNMIGYLVVNQSSTPLVDLRKASNVQLHPGDFLLVQLSPFVDHVTLSDALGLHTTLSGYQVVVMTPNATLTFPVARTTDVTVRILHCQTDLKLLPKPSDHVTVTWEGRGPWQRRVAWLRLETTDAECQSEKRGNNGRQQCVVHQARLDRGQREVRVPVSVLFSDHTYVTSLQPCFDHGCLTPFTSNPVTLIHPSSLTLTVSKASVLEAGEGEMNVTVTASLETLNTEAWDLVASQPCVVQWTVSRDTHAALSLSGWVVQQAPDCRNVQVGNENLFTSSLRMGTRTQRS